MTYEERQKQAAKRHAEKYNAGKRQEYAGGPYLRNDPEHMLDEAELTISMQAEAIREALNNCEAARIINPDNNWEQYLKSNGYIPEKEEE